MEEGYIKRIAIAAILVGLIVISFFLVKKILLSVAIGAILAMIFYPLYEWLVKHLKSKDLSATIICIILIIIILLPLWFLTPIIINQSVKVYIASQQIDFVKPLQSLFPALAENDILSAQIGTALYSFVTKVTNSLVSVFSDIIINLPTILLQLLVVLFTFYFFLRDKDEIISYLESLSPFPKETEKKLFSSSRDVTISVLYGQVVLGILQGLITGAGFFIFKVPNALLLTFLAVLAGIFPIIGTSVIYIPVIIFLLIGGNTVPAVGVLAFGIISAVIENFWKPVFISRRTSIHTSIILIGMISGLFVFGIIGVVLGPLILAYLLIVLEIYRNKKIPGALIPAEKSENK